MIGRGGALPEFHRLAALETDDHVLWPGAVGGNGYGRIRLNGSYTYVHRLALREPQPTDRRHACHKPGLGCPKNCMNYRHLYWGTHVENMADRIIDGTDPSGGRNPRAKLTDEDVAEIRLLAQTVPRRELGARFGVAPETVGRIIQKQAWV